MMTMRRLAMVAVAVAMATGGAMAGPLDNEVRSIVDRGRAGGALWTVYAVELKSGRELASLNEDKPFIPASNRKLVTAGVVTRAFEGSDRITTSLEAGAFAGGVASDVVLRAGGDPSWTPSLSGGRTGRSFLRALVRDAKSKGLRRIDGDVTIDTSFFTDAEPIPPGWAWDEFVNSYASRPAVLSLDMNLVGLSVKPTSPGEAPEVRLAAAGAPFEVVNAATTARAGAAPTLRIVQSPGGDRVEVEGAIPADSAAASRSVPMGAPVGNAAATLEDVLRDEGIEFSGRVVPRASRASGRGGQVLGTVQGAEMREILSYCMKESDNFLAESLYLLAAGKRAGRAGYQGAYEVERAMWKSLKVADGDTLPMDGSGLARANLVTSRALVALLRERSSCDWFVESLPVSGRSGTLRYRLSEKGMAGRVQAKTGTLDDTSSLSGYVRGASGRVIVFSIMANHHTASNATIRASIDDVVELLARQ